MILKMNESALLIEDDEQIRKLLRITLESNSYKVIEAANGKTGLALASNQNPDFILLDLGLPDMSGHEILLLARKWYDKPIIILSVQNDESNIVTALENGANDYLPKPFRTGELLARIRSAIRNRNEEKESVLKFADLEIDFSLRIVKVCGDPVKLTATEFALLSIFTKNAGRVLTHDYLLKNVWGAGYRDQSQYLRVFVAQLRKKIESNIDKPKYILTESGVGYRFVGE
jgi:two-component system KDP operon response regulator KdpE